MRIQFDSTVNLKKREWLNVLHAESLQQNYDYAIILQCMVHTLPTLF